MCSEVLLVFRRMHLGDLPFTVSFWIKCCLDESLYKKRVLNQPVGLKILWGHRLNMIFLVD